jgi:hypothetical protein
MEDVSEATLQRLEAQGETIRSLPVPPSAPEGSTLDDDPIGGTLVPIEPIGEAPTHPSLPAPSAFAMSQEASADESPASHEAAPTRERAPRKTRRAKKTAPPDPAHLPPHEPRGAPRLPVIARVRARDERDHPRISSEFGAYLRHLALEVGLQMDGDEHRAPTVGHLLRLLAVYHAHLPEPSDELELRQLAHSTRSSKAAP